MNSVEAEAEVIGLSNQTPLMTSCATVIESLGMRDPALDVHVAKHISVANVNVLNFLSRLMSVFIVWMERIVSLLSAFGS